MKKFATIPILLLTFLFLSNNIFAQGDNCASAVAIITNGLYTANGPSTGGGAFQGDATNADWYYFEATDNGTIDISACNLSNVDSRLHVYDGSCGALNLIGTSDDECTSYVYAAFLTGITVTIGNVYYIEWDDRWSTAGFDFNFTFTPYGTCPDPINLQATNASDISVDLGWTEIGSAALWNIEYGPVGFIPGTGTLISGVTTNPYTLSGLSSATSYDFYVQSDCTGGDLSNWSGPFSFSTASCSIIDQCTYTLVMTDQGNSWNNANIEVIQDGVSMGTFTVPGGGANTETINLCNGSNIQLVWSTGMFDNECMFELQDPNSSVIYSFAAGGAPPAGVFFTFVASCLPITCPYPSNLTSSNITTTAADIAWTENGSATLWNIEYGPTGFIQGTGTSVNGLTSNSYSISGLSTSTSYDFYVQSDCGGGDLSFWVGPFTFLTLCDIITAPYVEDFENSGIIPICWINDVGDFFDWTFGTSTPTGNTGPQSGDHTNGSGYFAYTESSNPNNPNRQADLISPWIDISSLTTPMLSFWYHMYGNSMGDLHIDINDGTWQNDVLVLSGNNGDVWTEAILFLSSYSSPVQVRFRGITGSSWFSDMAIDDVSFIEAPTCPQPSNLDVLSTTSSQATLSWTENGSATLWNIEYGLSGFTQGGGVMVSGVSANPYVLGSLMPAVTYDYYIQADCGGGDLSYWVGPFTFTTACNTINAPYLQNFENTGLIPNCWTNMMGDDFDWSFNTQTPSNLTGPLGDHTTGTGYFAFTEGSSPNFPTKQAELLTPWINISTLSVPSLNFWYNMYGAAMGELHVDLNDGTWHNDIFQTSGDQGDVWNEVYVNLSSYSSPVQVRFRGITGLDYSSDMAIDDVRFDEMPSCPSPVALYASNVTDATADLSWTENGSSTLWNIEYGPAGFILGTGVQIIGVTSNPYTLTGLTGSTDYEFYVISDCGGGDTSSWIGPIAFTTTVSPITNPSLCEIGIPIPDPGCLDQTVMVTTPGSEMGIDVLLTDVNLIISHTWDQDIAITLESPNGVVVDLSLNNGGGNDNYGLIDGTCTQYTNFNMAGVDGDITAGTPPYLGSFIPQGDLLSFNDNSDPNGIWIIHICDQFGSDIGALEYLELVFEQILPPADMIINEADVSQLGNDTIEFIEIYDGGIGNYPLDEYVVVLYNGSTDQCYQSFDLDGYSTDANGYFLLGNADIPGVGLIFADNLLQDGADAIALYKDQAANFPVGTGIILTNLEDALVYETADPTDIQLLALLNIGQPQIDEDILGNKEAHSMSRLPNGSGGQRNTYTYNAAMPTPGGPNNGVPEIVWNTSTFVEALVNDGSIETVGDIELLNNDFAFVGLLTENTDYTVANLPAGLAVEITTTSATTATITLTGNAVSHLDVDDVSNLTITFLDPVYNTYASIYVINNSNNTLIIDFFDSAPPTLVWDNFTFDENVLDDGSIANSINLSLYSETFAIASGLLTESTHYTTANVPAGLSVEINVIDTATATIQLVGNAVSHDNIDDINNMEITFLDTAFNTNPAVNVANYSETNIAIDFIQLYNDSTDILTYSFIEQTGPAVIDPVNHTVDIEVAFGTNVANLVATFTLSTGATSTIMSIPQLSAVSANDFTLPVIQNVLAEDTITNQDWTINVSVSTQNDQISDNVTEILVYPNPTDETLNLKISSESYEDYYISLINLQGQMVFEFSAESIKSLYRAINVKDLASGLYYLKVLSRNDMTVEKIIIK